ncbi:MAG: hypothetical protein ABIH56_03210, partial [Candidatus Margulisiibacteriota bacterium]
DNGGQAEVINNGQNGYLYRAGDRKSLAELMLIVCANQAKNELIGKEARAKVLRDHSLEKYRNNILNILREII